jgi:endonuclease/exonuclease/phosphatase family metal-dependent hydrolase
MKFIAISFLVFLTFSACGENSEKREIGEKRLRVASYNVENLFDLDYSGGEYKEYIPNSESGWNSVIYKKKLRNIAFVVAQLEADIIAFQEIENKNALLDLRDEIKKRGIYYKYSAIADTKQKKSKRVSVTTTLLSKFPIESISEVKVSNHPMNRDILEVGVKIGDEVLYIFVNHWKSKSGGESRRIKSAEALKERLDKFPSDTPYILLGDFNSNYNEYKTFLKSKHLNDSDGETGINHTLKTIEVNDWDITIKFKKMLGMEIEIEDTTKEKVAKQSSNELNYNLWNELPENDRWSYLYGRKKETLDNIIISKGLLDGKGIEFVDGTFKVFRNGGVLDKKGKVYRWQKDKMKRHIGKGFSDHLPIYADFGY